MSNKQNKTLLVKKHKWLLINLLLIFAFSAFLTYDLPALKHRFLKSKGCVISFIDVGKADSALIRLCDGRNILIDGGDLYFPGTKRNAFEEKLLPVLKKWRIDDFDAVISTHPHSDHIGGLTEILKKYPVRTVIDHGYTHTSFLYEKFWKTIKRKNIPVLKPAAGEELRLSNDAHILFLSPPKESGFESLNENSLVCKFIYKDVSFLFMADAGIPAEKWLMENMGDHLRSDVLKVGHHGSITSSHKEFIKAVSPKISVISVGPSSYQIPREEVLQVLEGSGTRIFRTDRNGTVTISTDGNSLTVDSER